MTAADQLCLESVGLLGTSTEQARPGMVPPSVALREASRAGIVPSPAFAEQVSKPSHRPSYLPPAAFLGYGIGQRGVYARVCAWCPGKDEADRWVAPLEISHTMCPACRQRFDAERLGEKIEA